MATGSDLSCHKERTNYLRLNRAIVDLGTSVLREILQQDIQPQDIQQELTKCPNLKLNNLQKQTLSAAGSYGYRYFDISLLYLLIRNLCTNIQPPTNGWNPHNPPNSTDISIGDDVERIRFIRNYIHGHMHETCVLEGAFQSHWKVLEGVMARMDIILGSHFTQDLALMKTDNMDFCALKEMQRKIIEKWKEDEVIFCNTRASECVADSVKSKPMVVVTGAPGSGKSAIAHHVAIALQSEGYTIVCVDSVEELQKNWETSHDQKLVFVMDDVFGVHTFDEIELGKWYKRMEKIKRYLSDNKIVITMRKHFSNDGRLSTFCSEFDHKIIDIGDEKLMLSEEEKISIFTKHIKNTGRNEKNISEITSCELFCFPLLCQIFAADTSNVSASSFFKHPFSVLKTQIMRLKEFAKEKFLGLILCAIFDNKLSESVFHVGKECEEIKNIREDFAELCRLPRNISRQDIQANLDSLIGTYVMKVGDLYKFLHDILHDVVVNAVTPEFHRSILEHCSSTFINQRVRFPNTIHPDDSIEDCQPYVILKDDLRKAWAERLVQDVKSGHFHVFCNVCLQDELHEKLFAECLATNKNVLERKHFYQRISYFENCSVNRTEKNISDLFLDNARYSYDITPLHLIVENKLKETFTFIINELPIYNELSTVFIQSGTLAAELLNISVIVNNMLVLQSFIDKGISIGEYDRYGFKPLHIAATHLHDEMVEILIDNGADVNQGDMFGNTPLHKAIMHKREKMVEILMDKVADINKSNIFCYSPVPDSIIVKQVKMIGILIDKGGDVHKENIFACSPLHHAIMENQEKMVEIMIDKGADINKSDSGGISPLHRAMLNKQNKIVEMLIDKGADFKSHIGSYTPLYRAINSKQDQMVEILIDKGADINEVDKYGNTLLHTAMLDEQDKILEILINKGVDINKGNIIGHPPLHTAICRRQDKMAEILIDKGADINKHCTNGHTPLHTAIMENHEKMVEILIDKGADINKGDEYGVTPLQSAIMEKQNNMVEILIDKGADINKRDNYGNTPLHRAINTEHYMMVEMLIDKGVDINKGDNCGNTPLQNAIIKDQEKMVEILIVKGADINKSNNYGSTPLQTARGTHLEKTVDILVAKQNRSCVIV